MATSSYRAYRFSGAGRIVSGERIEARGDADALRQARPLCDAATARVELWRRGRLVATIEDASPRPPALSVP